MQTKNSHRYLLPLAALLAILPLLARGPSCGHDFDFHLLSWLEAATQYAHGGYPHWAFTPAYNAGEPRFLFYPPISWTLGAFLTLALPIQFVGTAFTFVALTLSGFTAHALARRYATPPAALLASTLYLANPYMLFTAYERSAFAELLAAAWLPLLFLAALDPPEPPCPIHRVFAMSGIPTRPGAPGLASETWVPRTSARARILRTALPIALLWLSNAPAAVMACYALAILTLGRLLQPQTPSFQPSRNGGSSFPPQPGTPSFRPYRKGGFQLHLALTTLAGTTLGLLLPAFYLLPAAYERRYVQIAMATITGMRPQDHFFFHRMSGLTPDDLFHNDVVRTASLIALLLLTSIALFSLINRLSSRWKQGEVEGPAIQPTTILTILIAFLLTPPSLVLWRHTPQLAFLQFPWRLCALLAVILLITAAQAIRTTRFYLAPILAAALILPAYTLFHQPCDATDTPRARAALFHSPLGTEPTDEYTPTDADNDALHPLPSWSFSCITQPTPPATQPPGQAPTTLEADLPCPATVTLNRRTWPNWLLTVNGRPATLADPTRDDGRIAFTAPGGHLSLRLSYHCTPDQTLGFFLSAFAALIALFLWRSPASFTLGKSKSKH